MNAPNGEITSLGIVGASVRACAQSARKAGLSIWAADLFADRDGPPGVSLVHDFSELINPVSAHRSIPWMYTGGLENYPRILDEMRRIAPLLGVCGRELRTARDPWALREILLDLPTPFADLLPGTDRFADAATDGQWLLKPRRSAGGLGIRRWEHGDRLESEGQYLQRFCEGVAETGLFVGDGRRAVLLGITTSWQDSRNCPTHPFLYAGSMGPLDASRKTSDEWTLVGNRLTGACGLKGIFGVDAIRTHEGLRIIEVNPRYTASMELLEWIDGISMVELHLDAWLNDRLPAERQRSATSLIAGKAIVYARHHATVAAELSDHWYAQRLELPDAGIKSAGMKSESVAYWADIPAGGTEFSSGMPVCTILRLAFNEGQLHYALRKDVELTQKELEAQRL